MRKRKIGLMLGCSVLAVLLLAGLYAYKIYMDYRVPVPYTDRIMAVPIVENLDFLEGKEKLTSGQNPGVYFGHALLPYGADGTLYLSQNFEVEEWVGELVTGSRDTFLCTLPDAAWSDKAASIRDNHVFTLWLVGEESYYELKLVVSGMPVMTITTEREEQQDLGDYDTDPDRFVYDPEIIWYGQMQLFNPGVGVSRYEITETGVKYYLRGDSSSSFEKDSYSLGLLDSKGENLNASLLGMRSDNSWKLKNMVADTSKVREKTACQIWEMFDQSNPAVSEPGPRMEYVELIVDNDYVGFYGLVEPVDEKKLGLDKNDVLYKSTNWLVPEDEDIQYAVDHGWRLMTYIRIRYPDIITDYGKTWYPMRDYLNTFYHDGGDERPAQEKLNLSNAIDMLLFNMAVSGSDNYFRNLYFVADVSEDGSYSMRQIPWDLDLTFGKIVSGGFNEDETVVYEENAIPYLRETSPDSVNPLLQQRWEECRGTFLSAESIMNLMYENMDYLINSGVVARENERWPDYRMSTNLSKIEDYQIRRMEWLDGYFTDE